MDAADDLLKTIPELRGLRELSFVPGTSDGGVKISYPINMASLARALPMLPCLTKLEVNLLQNVNDMDIAALLAVLPKVAYFYIVFVLFIDFNFKKKEKKERKKERKEGRKKMRKGKGRRKTNNPLPLFFSFSSSSFFSLLSLSSSPPPSSFLA